MRVRLGDARDPPTVVVRILLTGGGTGGHIYPAIAIAETLEADAELQPVEFLFVGTRRGLEAQIVPKNGLPIDYVEAAPLERKFSFALVRTLFANLAGIFQSLRIVRRFRPDLAIATGGYVTFPVFFAAWMLRVPRLLRTRLVLLEPNVRPGLTNRILRPLVDEVWLAFASPGRRIDRKERLTGTPVRASFPNAISKEMAREQFGLDREKTTIVVFGGSQGARSLNDAVVAFATSSLPPTWQILLVSGDRDYDEIAKRAGGIVARAAGESGNLRVERYLDDPSVAYAAADLVVARAGASTLAELAATATPALLVPYPFATGNHQSENAEVLRASRAARILADRDLTERTLRAELESALAPESLSAMREAAHERATVDSRAAITSRVRSLA